MLLVLSHGRQRGVRWFPAHSKLGYLVLAIQSSQKLVVTLPQSAQDLRKISVSSLHANTWRGTLSLLPTGCFICWAYSAEACVATTSRLAGTSLTGKGQPSCYFQQLWLRCSAAPCFSWGRRVGEKLRCTDNTKPAVSLEPTWPRATVTAGYVL